MHGVDDVRVDQIPSPIPADDEAVVRVLYGGLCGSDLHYWKYGAAGESILREPMILGHEVVGIVERADAHGIGPAAGTAVAVHPARYGDASERFPVDRPNISPAVSYLGSAARLPHTDGTFADLVVLPGSMLRPLPSDMDVRTAALVEPASVAWHALTRAGDVKGKRVLVNGAGPIGALIVAAAATHGASEIIAVDLYERPLEIARQVGATRVLNATDTDAVHCVDADVTFESSGSPRGLSSALAATTRGGRIVMVGLQPAGDQPIPIATAITREFEMVGAFRFHDEIEPVIDALYDGRLFVSPIVSHVFPIEDALTALHTASDPSTSGKVLLDFT